MDNQPIPFREFPEPFERMAGQEYTDDPRFIKSPVRNEYGPAYIRQLDGRWLFGVACVLPFDEVEVSEAFVKAWLAEFSP